MMLAFGNDTLSEPGGDEIRPARVQACAFNISRDGTLYPPGEVLPGQVVNF